jgi:hypothetical protein
LERIDKLILYFVAWTQLEKSAKIPQLYFT